MPKNIFIKLLVLLTLTAPSNAELNKGYLQEYKWKKRVVLLFSDSKENDIYSRQIKELEKNSDENEDRDLKIITILDTSENQSYYQTYNVKSLFSITLLGKDGFVKLKEDNYIAPKQIYELIDSMPMRQLEIFEKEVFE